MSDKILITIETLTARSFTIWANLSDTIERIKSKIAFQEELNPKNQHIIFGYRELADHEVISEIGIKEKSILKLVTKLKGGPVDLKRLVLPNYSDIPEGFLGQNENFLVLKGGKMYLICLKNEIKKYPKIRTLEDELRLPFLPPINQNLQNQNHKMSNSNLTLGKSAIQEKINQINEEVRIASLKATPNPPYTLDQLNTYVRIKLLLLKEEERRQQFLMERSSHFRFRSGGNLLKKPSQEQDTKKTLTHIQESSRDRDSLFLPLIVRERENTFEKVGFGFGDEIEDEQNDENKNKYGHKPRQVSAVKKKIRCNICKKKLGLIRYQCRCNGRTKSGQIKYYCSFHRNGEDHKCSFDYKNEGKTLIQ